PRTRACKMASLDLSGSRTDSRDTRRVADLDRAGSSGSDISGGRRAERLACWCVGGSDSLEVAADGVRVYGRTAVENYQSFDWAATKTRLVKSRACRSQDVPD